MHMSVVCSRRRAVSGFDATPVELQVCGSTLADISQEIHTVMRTLTNDVDALLSGGWKGRAAQGFAHGWDQWQTGANDVLSALKAMGDLLGAAGRNYGLTDGASADMLGQPGVEL